jgi:hypothetical protein
MGLTTLPCKKKIVEKPPRNSAGFCGGGQSPSWAVEPREEDEIMTFCVVNAICSLFTYINYLKAHVPAHLAAIRRYIPNFRYQQYQRYQICVLHDSLDLRPALI